jgi:hypothetical protein
VTAVECGFHFAMSLVARSKDLVAGGKLMPDLIRPDNTLFVILSCEGPDRYAQAGGPGTRVTQLGAAPAGCGYETHLFFVGDPSLPGLELLFPFGLVGLEAMAAGGIVLTGSTGEEYICDGQEPLWEDPQTYHLSPRSSAILLACGTQGQTALTEAK